MRLGASLGGVLLVLAFALVFFGVALVPFVRRRWFLRYVEMFRGWPLSPDWYLAWVATVAPLVVLAFATFFLGAAMVIAIGYLVG
jgi:hypothetical protein